VYSERVYGIPPTPTPFSTASCTMRIASTPRREPPAHPRQVLSSSPTSRRGQAKGKFSAEGRLQRASASPSGDPTRDLTMPAMGHRFESPQVHHANI
jgi:hypothetical protein